MCYKEIFKKIFFLILLILLNLNFYAVENRNPCNVDCVRKIVNEEISKVNTSNENLKSELDDLKAQVNSNSANIAANTSNIATNTANIVINTANIATNTAAIAAIEQNKVIASGEVEGASTLNVPTVPLAGGFGFTSTRTATGEYTINLDNTIIGANYTVILTASDQHAAPNDDIGINYAQVTRGPDSFDVRITDNDNGGASGTRVNATFMVLVIENN